MWGRGTRTVMAAEEAEERVEEEDAELGRAVAGKGSVEAGG